MTALLRSRRRWLHRASWACFALAGMLVAYVGVSVGYQDVVQGQLSGAWSQQHPSASIPDVSTSTTTASSMSLHLVPHQLDGQAIARLELPSIGFDAIVTEGDGRGILSGGPGHDDRTGYPSEGRLILFANHNGFSLSWGSLKPGDAVVVEMPYGRFHYTVVSRTIISGDDSAAINSAPAGEVVRLVTCWPLWEGALASQRLVLDAVPAAGP